MSKSEKKNMFNFLTKIFKSKNEIERVAKPEEPPIELSNVRTAELRLVDIENIVDDIYPPLVISLPTSKRKYNKKKTKKKVAKGIAKKPTKPTSAIVGKVKTTHKSVKKTKDTK